MTEKQTALPATVHYKPTPETASPRPPAPQPEPHSQSQFPEPQTRSQAITAAHPTDFLIAHERWANRNLITACKDLTEDQFHLNFNMGPGTLHNTITHVLGALRGWGDVLAQRDSRPRLEEAKRSADELLALNEEAMDDIAKSIAEHEHSEIVTPSRGDQTYAFVRGGVIAHVFTHSFHHRAQCLNMLKALEVDPLPAVSILEYMMMVEPVKV